MGLGKMGSGGSKPNVNGTGKSNLPDNLRFPHKPKAQQTHGAAGPADQAGRQGAPRAAARKNLFASSRRSLFDMNTPDASAQAAPVADSRQGLRRYM